MEAVTLAQEETEQAVPDSMEVVCTEQMSGDARSVLREEPYPGMCISQAFEAEGHRRPFRCADVVSSVVEGAIALVWDDQGWDDEVWLHSAVHLLYRAPFNARMEPPVS